MKDRKEVLEQIESTGVVAVVRAESSRQLLDVVGALQEGGLTCIEITMTTPDALQVIAEASRAFGDRCAIGVGTVLDAETARAAILAGAEFIVSPILDLATVRLAKRYSKVVIPGAFTPTEIVAAWQAGGDLVKVFPATKLGPEFFSDMRGPLPHIKLTPTGGVSLDNAAAFIRAGAVALGVGSALVSKKALAEGDMARLSSNARAFLEAVRQARTGG